MYIGLHNHTDRSNIRGFLDSTNRIEDLVQYTKELGHCGIAITDHDTIAVHMEALDYMENLKKSDPEKWKDYKLILGNEIYLCSRKQIEEDKLYKFWHFILIAKDKIGHQQIRELSTRAWTDNSFSWVNIRTPTFYDDLFEVLDKDRGHLVGSTACFRKGTSVLTKEGIKNIENITSEDYIKNRYGVWEKVNYPTSRLFDGIGYEVDLYGIPEKIICTDTHKFLTTTSHKNSKWASKKDKNNPFSWKTMGEVTIKNGSDTDFLLYPISVEYDIKKAKIKREEWENSYFKISKYSHRRYKMPDEIIITPNLMRFFGLWLGDGWITLKKNPNIGISFNKKEFIYYFDFLKSVEEELKIKWVVNKERQNKIDVQCTSRDFIDFMYYIFKESHAVNKFIPDRIKNISKELDMELVFGFLLADGYFRIRENGNGYSRGYRSGEFVGASISKKLIYGIKDLLNSLEISSGISISEEHIDKNQVHHKRSYYLSGSNVALGELNKKDFFSHEKVCNIFEKAAQERKKDFLEIDGIIYRKVRVKKIKKIQLKEQVYCLNVDSHSFVCNGVIVHNFVGGFAANLVVEAYNENPDDPDYHKLFKWLKCMDERFGHGNFFLEMQPSDQQVQIITNDALLKASQELDIPYIITTDSHYLKKEDRPIHEAFLNSNEDSGKERELGEFYATTYVMSEAEIHEYLDKYLGYDVVQKGIDNTQLVYDMVEEYSLKNPLKIPYEPDDLTEPSKELYEKYVAGIPLLKDFFESKYQADRHLVREIVNRIEKDFDELGNQKTYDAINTCLKVIKNTSDKMDTQWSAYLLQTRKFVDAIWACDSLCGPSRGSGGGFILLYILGITQINPLREDTPLYYWRFLHEYRASVLDVDLDCQGDKRDTIIKYLQDKYGGPRRVCKVQTLLTMKSKNAIITACRGLGITTEEAQFLSSFIGAERGIQYTLKQVYYGDPDNNIPVNTEFRNLMSGDYAKVWEVAQKIEGLVSGVGQHAGGVILSPSDMVNYTALMKSSSGDIITQFDLHKLEQNGLIKWDLLAIDALQKIHICMNLLLEDGYIEWQGTLKDTYEKYIGVYNIERDNPEIWKMINEHKIMSLFQMEKQTGYQAIAIGHPESLVDLSALNSVMRLMPPTPDAETPLERFGKYKQDISLWYKEMDEFGLTEHEQEVVKKYAEKSYGLLPNQEDFMMAVQDPEIGGFDLLWSDRLRKSVAKKSPKDYVKLQEEFYDNIEKKNLSPKLCHYVWDVLIAMNRG